MTNAALWTSAEAAQATGGKNAADWVAGGISIDSRSLQYGDLFVALQGPNFDGHDFVAKAFEAGAAAAMVSHVPDDLPEGAALLVVDDTMAALEDLGRAARNRVGAKIIAVTGSVGKTGTKEALRLVLAEQGGTHASAGSLNNQWGVPLSLARMPRDAAFAVFELGMNHAGELEPLSKLVRPHVAIVTTVEATHLEFFESLRAIAEAKAEIFCGIEPGGAAVINRDNPHFDLLAERANEVGVVRILPFGSHPEARVRLLNHVLHPNCSCITADVDGHTMTYKVGAPGRHWVMNSLAVLAAVTAVGADLGLAGLALARMSAPKGRGQRHHVEISGGAYDLIDDSYNASPASMRAAFETLKGMKPGLRGRRIAVLGDMLELGEDSPRLHAELAGDIEAAGIDLVFTAGEMMAHLDAALPGARRGLHAERSIGLLERLVGEIRNGDVVLVKGSFGSRMGLIVEELLGEGNESLQAVNA